MLISFPFLSVTGNVPAVKSTRNNDIRSFEAADGEEYSRWRKIELGVMTVVPNFSLECARSPCVFVYARVYTYILRPGRCQSAAVRFLYIPGIVPRG